MTPNGLIFSFSLSLQLTYFGMLGHESCNLIKYLEGFEGVAPIKKGHNPATWMLEVTGGATSTGVKASKIDFPAAYKVTLAPLLCCPCFLCVMSR